MINRKWKVIEVTDKVFVPFQWRDLTPGSGNLGRAEFQVCLRFKGSEVSEFWVYPIQTRMDTCWHYIGGDIYFTITAYERMHPEGAWMIRWCDEHQGPQLSIYSPTDAKFLEIDRRGLSFWQSNVYHIEGL